MSWEEYAKLMLGNKKVKGKLKLGDILCAKKLIDNKVKDNGKDKRK